MGQFFFENNAILGEIIYTLCGLVSISTAMRALKNEKAPIGTFIFWFLLGIMFMTGHFLVNTFEWGAMVIGVCMFVLGVLALFKQVQPGKFEEVSLEERQANAKKHGNLIFLPAIILAVVAMVLSQLKLSTVVNGEVKTVSISGAFAIGIAAILALIVGILITKMPAKEINEGSNRLLMQVGSSSLLPQYLGALGSLFSAAGVGTVISNIISTIIPEGNLLLGIIAYVLGMVIFTVIMGNAFAAFTVITIGIGIPFVIAQGANPAIVGSLGMTAGYCGTLITPMAANFNIVPANVLETKNNYSVIRKQLPLSIIMMVIHVILMLVLA